MTVRGFAAAYRAGGRVHFRVLIVPRGVAWNGVLFIAPHRAGTIPAVLLTVYALVSLVGVKDARQLQLAVGAVFVVGQLLAVAVHPVVIDVAGIAAK